MTVLDDRTKDIIQGAVISVVVFSVLEASGFTQVVDDVVGDIFGSDGQNMK
jgi:hypothetical protein